MPAKDLIEEAAMHEPQRASPLRTVSRLRPCAVSLALALALVLGVPCGAQNQPAGSPQSNVQYLPRLQESAAPLSDEDPVLREKRLRALNEDRQKHLVSDAAKLLKLATELNAEVSSGNSDALTPSELRKVAEIEKLARSVKDKMSFTMGDMPGAPEPFPPRHPYPQN